jgi:uncharacterized protein (TIGR02001 family)
MKPSQKAYLRILFGILITLSTAYNAHAQVSFGTDVASRYIWRGIDFGQSLSFQPSLSVAKGGFELGAWGAYANSGGATNELDLYLSYSVELKSGAAFSFGVTDYYFPATPGQFLNFDTDGNHLIEPFLGVSTASFSLTAYMNVLNDPDNSLYLHASTPFEVDDNEITLHIGVLPYASAWYGTSKAAIQDIGVSVSREVQITESFSLPLFSSYIINPYQEVSFLLFGFSL